jgi:hypothetical protein
MTMTIEEAHKLYKTRNLSYKIGLTSFSKLKPVNVKKVSETSRRSRLCQICCNIVLKVEVLTTVKRAAKERGIPEDIQIDKSLSNVTFYNYKSEPSVKCLTRNCENCGNEGLHHWMYSNLVPVKESRLYLTLENTTIKFTEMHHH